MVTITQLRRAIESADLRSQNPALRLTESECLAAERAQALHQAAILVGRYRYGFRQADGDDVADIFNSAVADKDFHVVSKSEHERLRDDSKAIYRFAAEVLAVLKSEETADPLQAIRDLAMDRQRFTNFATAMSALEDEFTEHLPAGGAK